MPNSELHFNKRVQIFLLVLVVFIGVGGTALGALNVRSSILNPFNYEGSDSVTVPNTLSQEGAGFLDTDGDGLLDDEELNNYGTSPYLDDSDSDGLTDGEEIASGSDPNCPIGQDCNVNYVTQQPDVASPSNIQNSNLEDSLINSGLQPGIQQLREMLVAGGMSREQVNAISDEDILRAYQQVSSDITISTNSGNEINELRDLSATEIRELMARQGIDKNLYNNLSDAELIQLYRQSFESVR